MGPRSREGLVTSSAGSLVEDGAQILKFICGASRAQHRQNDLNGGRGL